MACRASCFEENRLKGSTGNMPAAAAAACGPAPPAAAAAAVPAACNCRPPAAAERKSWAAVNRESAGALPVFWRVRRGVCPAGGCAGAQARVFCEQQCSQRCGPGHLPPSSGGGSSGSTGLACLAATMRRCTSTNLYSRRLLLCREGKQGRAPGFGRAAAYFGQEAGW